MPLGTLKVRDYQLYLLKTMNPPGSLLEEALEALDSTRDEMLAAYEAVSPMVRLRPGSPERIKSILADSILDEKPDGADRQTSVYGLSLWPRFVFCVKPEETGLFIERAWFARFHDVRSENFPALWNFLESDLIDAFDDVHDIDGWGHYSSYTAQNKVDGQQYFLRFAWGLLQEMEEMVAE
jgi:hypothetical protein